MIMVPRKAKLEEEPVAYPVVAIFTDWNGFHTPNSSLSVALSLTTGTEMEVQIDRFIYTTTITGKNNSDSKFTEHDHYLGDIFNIGSDNTTDENGKDQWLVFVSPQSSVPLPRTLTPPVLSVAVAPYSAHFDMMVLDSTLGAKISIPDVRSDGVITVPSNSSLRVALQLEVTSPWREILVGPLAKLIKGPDPTRKWVIKQKTQLPGAVVNGNALEVEGPLEAITIYDEELTKELESVVNSFLSPFGVAVGIVALLFGGGRHKPYGWAHTFWYFRRPASHGGIEHKRFKIYPTTNGEYVTPHESLEERIRACEEMREMLLNEFIEVHESQTDVGNDGGPTMGWAKVADQPMTQVDDQQLRVVRVENA
ncbi:hypothetical protein HK104_002317 [Borealophlyctis nickersoniae]|nr:hypothetical protein HK104_002317 [Borealophlyctis nickersoniae]